MHVSRLCVRGLRVRNLRHWGLTGMRHLRLIRLSRLELRRVFGTSHTLHWIIAGGLRCLGIGWLRCWGVMRRISLRSGVCICRGVHRMVWLSLVLKLRVRGCVWPLEVGRSLRLRDGLRPRLRSILRHCIRRGLNGLCRCRCRRRPRNG